MWWLVVVMYCFMFRSVHLAEVVSDVDFNFWYKSPSLSLFPSLPIAFPWSTDEQCRKDSQLLIEHLKNHTFWAVQMYESSTREMDGILFGHMKHMGQFDECMRVQQPIKTQMCPAEYEAHTSHLHLSAENPYDIDPPYNESAFKKLQDSRADKSKFPRYRAMLSLCLPRSCSRSALSASAMAYLEKLNDKARLANQTTYSVTFPYECEDDVEQPFKADEIAFWTCTCAILLLALTSTLIDFCRPTEFESKGRKLLMAFSLKRNWKKFITHEQDPSPLDFLYGFKFISICLLQYDHRAAIFLGTAVFNYQKIEEELRGYNRIFIPSGDLGLGTFFFIAGLLSLYLIMEVREKRYVNPLIILLARYIRMIPLYMYVVWFHASALLRTGSGVGWKYGMKNESLYCAKNWWTNALFINNYVNPGQMCMLHSWYLSCDYQLFIVCVFVTYLIIKNRKLGVSLLILLTIVSILVPGIMTVVYKLPPIMLYYSEFVSHPREYPTFIWHYIKTHNRGESYLIGMISGYVLYRTRTAKKKIGTTLSVFFNLFGLLLLFLPMLYGARYYDIQYEYGLLEAGVFNVARRLVWTIGIVVIMFTYRFGHIPIMGSICTSMTMIILSKLSLGMYLLHFIYQMADHANDRNARPFANVDLGIQGTSDTVQIGIYALILYHLIELPFRELFKELVFSRMEKNTPRQISTIQSQRTPYKDQIELPVTQTAKL